MKRDDAAIAAPVTRSELAAMPVAPGAAAEPTVAPPSGDDGGGGLDRERLCNDILNTGVMGALIGGFALSNLQAGFDTAVTLDVAIYLTSFIGVHACTCSCVTSALLYRVANALHDTEAAPWAKAHPFLLKLPMAKFGMGCLSYLLSVVLLSFRDLEGVDAIKYAALVIGLMSMSMTLGVGWFLLRQTGPRPAQQALGPGDT